MNSTARCGQAHSIRVHWTAAGLTDSIRLKATGRALHRHAALLRLPAAAGHYIYLPRDHGERAGAGDHARREAGKNIFAAGEVMAGNILGKGYLAGFGLTIGSVFGRIAGREAARRATA